jgi:hypothetical protein
MMTNGVMMAMAPSSDPVRRNLPCRRAEGDVCLGVSMGMDRSS